MTEIAYGFTNYRDVLTDRVDTIGIDVVNQMVAESARVWTEEVNALLARFVMRTISREFKVNLFDGSGTMQPLDADGNPRKRTVTGNYPVAFPIAWYGDAMGFNRDTRALITVGEMNRWTLEQQTRDLNTLRRNFVKAIIWKDEWTFEDKSNPNLPDLVIKPFANGDAVTYQKRSAQAPTTDNHYVGQANAIDDGADNPFPGIFTDLWEHPSNMLRQNGYVISLIADNLVTSVEALEVLKEVTDSLIIPGISSDRVSDEILNLVPIGDKIIGYANNNIIASWSELPSNYIFSYAPMAETPAVAMREEPDAGRQGLVNEFENADGNHQTIRLLRKFGMGVQNRVAGRLTYIGNATYQNPAAYSPLVQA